MVTASGAKVLKKISHTTILQAINTGLPFVTIPWYVNKLGVSGYGKIGVALTIMQFLQLIVEYGFSLTATRILAGSDEKSTVGSQLFADITTIKLLILVFGVAFISVGIYVVGIQTDLAHLIFIGFLLVLGQAITPAWLFQGWHESVKLMNLIILPKALTVPVIFLTIRQDVDINFAMFLYVTPYFFTGILCVYVARKKKFIKFEKPSFYRMKKEIRNSFSLFKSSIATSASTLLTQFMISSISGAQELGLYLIAEKIKQGIQAVLMPISIVAYPRIVEKNSTSPEESFYIIQRLAMHMMIGVAITATIISIFSVEIITIIFGDSAIEAVDPLRVLMLATGVTFLNSIASDYIMIPFGREKKYSQLRIYSAILHVIMIWPLIRYYGYVGASVGVLVSEAFLSFLMIRHLLVDGQCSGDYNVRSSLIYKILVAERVTPRSIGSAGGGLG